LVADTLLRLKHGDANTSPAQFVRGGEAGLAPTDHHRLQLLKVTHLFSLHLSVHVFTAVSLYSVW